jgi:hypothetical protein
MPTLMKAAVILLMVCGAIPAKAESLCSISAKAHVEIMNEADEKQFGFRLSPPTVAALSTAWDNGKQAKCSASFVPAPDFCETVEKAARSPEVNRLLRGSDLPVARRIAALVLTECAKTGGRPPAPLGRAWDVSLWDDDTGITVRWWATDTPDFGGQFQARISK